jgi:tetratricopeptide (TPR) repeat protein
MGKTFLAKIQGTIRYARSAWLLANGVDLMEKDRASDALQSFGTLLRLYGHCPEPDIQNHVAYALFNKAFLLAEMGNHIEAIGQYDELVHRLQGSADPATDDIHLKALFNLGYSLRKTGRSRDALDTFEELISRIERSDAVDPDLKAGALLSKGCLLADLGNYDDAQETLEELLKRFNESQDAAVQVSLAEARDRLDVLGRNEI